MGKKKFLKQTINILLNELRDECLKVAELINKLEAGDLSKGEAENVFGELAARITHLNLHSEITKEELDNL